MDNDDMEIFTPAEAVVYLREKRGIHLEVASLRNRRRMGTAHAKRVLKTTTLWTKAELDALKPPRAPRRPKKNDDSSRDSSVMLMVRGRTKPLVA